MEANPKNSLRSTGPRTLEGKQIAARNALKHGLTSTSVLLPGDDPAEYQRFANGIKIYWAPYGEQEHVLVQLIIDGSWFCLRFSRIEAGVLRYLLSDDIEHDLVVDIWDRIFDTVTRYGTTKERALSRAIRDLERLQDRRRRQVSRPAAERLVHVQDRARIFDALEGKQVGEAPLKQIAMGTTKADPVGNGGSALARARKARRTSEASRTLESK